MRPGDFGGKVSISLNRAAPFIAASGLFKCELPGKPGESGFGPPVRVGVVGEASNPDLTGV